MFCPVCKDEYRPSFTRCATCDVDLVDSHADLKGRVPHGTTREQAASAPAYVPMVEFCGFLLLDEARAARDRLRGEGIRAQILIRESPASDGSGTLEEENWLLVERDRQRQVRTLLGFDEHQEAETEDETFDCGECGAQVASEETFCPKCGARFEDD